MSSGESPTVAALQDVLAGEHAAVYVYGVLGAQTSRSRQRTLYEDVIGAFLAHRQRRDRLTATITRLGDQPVAADPAYDVPADLSTSTHVEAAALHVERGCAKAYAYAIANTTGADRRWLTDALLDAATREIAFRGSPQDFPGI